MSSDAQNSDSLLLELGGCGRFQILLAACACLTYVTAAFSTIFMVYGSYNPGWRCLDNVTSLTNASYDSHLHNNADGWIEPNVTSDNGFTESCTGFTDCKHVEFNTESSTIVTEWGLICANTWKVSLIISLQMAGLALGNNLGGLLCDAIGRKLTLYIHVFIHTVLMFVSVAPPTWEMFAALRFAIGISCGVIFNASSVYMIEFVTKKWRTVILSLPLWCIGCTIFSVCAAVFKNWRYLHVFNGVFSFLTILPALKCPESLRWLAVKNKEKRTQHAVSQIAKINRVDMATLGSLSYLFPVNRRENCSTKINVTVLFRKGHRRITFILLFAIFNGCLLYYSTSFGLAALPGNIYVNNFIVFVTDLPANAIASFLPNIIGRKPTGIAGHLVQALSVLVFLGFDLFSTGINHEIGVLISIIITRLCNSVIFYLAVTLTNELYPTVIRSVALGLMLFSAGVAGMVSPYMVMSNDVMRVTFSVMAALSLIGCGLFVFVPETLGKDLEDDLNDDGSLENDEEAKV